MLYELTVFGSYVGQQIVNRWNYVSTGESSGVLGSFGLIYAFGAIASGTPKTLSPTGVLGNIMHILSDGFVLSSVSCRAASNYDPTDFYEVVYADPINGDEEGEALSPVLSFGYKTNIIRTDIGRGTKRFVGVPEASVSSGGVVTPAYVGYTANIASRMSEVLTYTEAGTTFSYTPSVVQKKAYTTPKGRRAYRYYPTLVEQLEHTAQGVSWTPYPQVRSQTSRQYGRGA